MSKSINKHCVLGHLGKAPEVRVQPTFTVATFSVATNESWVDKNSGAKQERTDWHNVVVYNKLAEIAGQYLKKGDRVYLEGRSQTRKWQNSEGQDRYTTEIIVNEMVMLENHGAARSDNASNTPELAKSATAPTEPEVDHSVPADIIDPTDSSEAA